MRTRLQPLLAFGLSIVASGTVAACGDSDGGGAGKASSGDEPTRMAGAATRVVEDFSVGPNQVTKLYVRCPPQRRMRRASYDILTSAAGSEVKILNDTIDGPRKTYALQVVTGELPRLREVELRMRAVCGPAGESSTKNS